MKIYQDWIGWFSVRLLDKPNRVLIMAGAVPRNHTWLNSKDQWHYAIDNVVVGKTGDILVIGKRVRQDISENRQFEQGYQVIMVSSERRVAQVVQNGHP